MAGRKGAPPLAAAKVQPRVAGCGKKQGHGQLTRHTRHTAAVLGRGAGRQKGTGGGEERGGGASGAAGGLPPCARASQLWCLLALPSVIRALPFLSPPIQRPAVAAITLAVICQLLLPPHAPRPRPSASPSFVLHTPSPRNIHRIGPPPASATPLPWPTIPCFATPQAPNTSSVCSMYLTEELFETAGADRPFYPPSKQAMGDGHHHEQHPADGLGKRKRNGDDYTSSTV